MASALNTRLETSLRLRKWFAQQSNDTIINFLAQPNHRGLGGDAFHAIVNGKPVFLKAVPLTNLEMTTTHYRSTKNIFNLPTYYQYGVGSTGFGVWRELITHEQASSWVETGLSTNFPILYHWREIKYKASYLRSLDDEEIDKEVTYWNHSAAVRERLLALRSADRCIVMIGEYFPMTLQHWLSEEILAGSYRALAAINRVQEALSCANDLMATNNMIHFDAHFRNIVTDGNEVLLTDFGLAMLSHFELSADEKKFFNQHRKYDRALSAVNIVHGVLTSIFDSKAWIIHLKDFLNGDAEAIPEHLKPTVRKYGDITLIMDKFFSDVQHASKLTPFPHEQIDTLVEQIP